MSAIDMNVLGPQAEARLAVASVSKSFGPTHALVDLTFDVGPGEIRGLVGANGAGKSTLINCIAGLLSPDRGSIEIDGVEVSGFDVRAMLRADVRVAHQELAVVRTMSVADNIAMGAKLLPGLQSAPKRDALYAELFEEWGIPFAPNRAIGELTPPMQAAVSLSKALVGDCKVLLLDEPTAALGPVEVEGLLRIVNRKAASGTSVIYVSHRLAEVAEICDTVTVLRGGRNVYQGDIADVDEAGLSELITRGHAESSAAAVMLGSGQFSDDAPGKRIARRTEPVQQNLTQGRSLPPALEVRELALHSVVQEVTLTVGEGEIVGLAGLVGAGRTELLEAIAGVRPTLSGEMTLHGTRFRPKTPHAAIAHGVVMVPEERAAQAIFAGRDILFNISSSRFRSLGRGPGGMIASRSRYSALAADLAAKLGLKARSLRDEIGSLSGGNQQKVVLGRSMLPGLRVLLLDEPSRGLDVGARADLRELVREIAEAGVAVIYVSSELAELQNCDRIVVMSEGRIVGEAPSGADFDEESLIAQCFPRSRAAGIPQH